MMMSRIEKLRRRIDRQGQHLSRLERARAAEVPLHPDEYWGFGNLFRKYGCDRICKDDADYLAAMNDLIPKLTDAELQSIIERGRASCGELDLTSETAITASSPSTEPRL